MLYTPHPLGRTVVPSGTAEKYLERAFPKENEYLYDPTAWMEDKLGWVWSKQADVADSVCDNRHTAVHACHGPGKSYVAAGLACWWLDVHAPGDAFLVTTAPTQTQIKAILWREITRHHRKAALDGYITNSEQPQWKLPDGELIGFGRKPQDYTDTEQAKAAFQGIHARFVLVILDEAAGVPEWLWEAVEGLVTNANARLLAIGNPDDPSSHFAKVCSPGSGWNVIGISAFETPNFTGEYVPPEVSEMLTSPIWVEERGKRWGKKSPLYVSRVLGKFPKVGTDQLIQPDWILAAQNRDLTGTATASGQYGVDVARSGTDESVICRRRGSCYRVELAEAGIADTMELAGHVKQRIEPHLGKVPAVIDTIGVGAGVFDRLSEQGLNVVSFNASNKAYDTQKFLNRRAEQFWHVRNLFRTGQIDIAQEDDELASQLGTIKWKVNSKGQTVIESKEDMARRGQPSPDRADALMYATVEQVGMHDFVESDQNTLSAGQQTITGDLLEIDW